MFTLSGSGQERLKKRRSCGTKGRTVTIMKDNLVNESGDLANDCISRQAVLDAMRDNYRDGGRDIDGDYVEGNYSEKLYDAIMSLPKMYQSEVKKC